MRKPDQSLTVCALVPYPPDTTPSQRFRIEQWRTHLESLGIFVELVPFANERLMGLLHKPGRRGAKALANFIASVRRVGDAIKTRRFDVVLIHRAACIAGPALVERLVALLGRPMIYDFDDAIFKLHTTEANRHFGWLKFPGKTATLCRLSNHVVVANEYLASYARRLNQHVTVIPSSIDIDRHRLKSKNGRPARMVIGWMGSSTSQTHLEMFAPVLREMLTAGDLELRVVSDREPLLPGVRYVWRPWSADAEIEELSQFDIGIMPMPDDEWARGKSAMKALLYMSMGLATICSPVGANREVIRHDENGLLAATPEEWVAGVKRLATDDALRRRLGAMGRQTVEQRYSMHRCAELFAKVVESVVSDRRLPVTRKAELKTE